MVIRYALTPKLRRKLKEPIGILIRGSFSETMKRFKDIIEKEKPQSIISVGDTVSKNLAKNYIFPQLSIIDNRVMRRKTKPLILKADEILNVKNPAGTITEEAIITIQNALRTHKRVKIIVDGEEDLLALIAVLYAPENSYIIYGQPREGIVIVKVTRQKKEEIAEILKAMETASKS